MNTLTAILPRRLTDWHEGRAAARMLVAALAAYLLTTMIHLPGPYSAVITTLIVARPHSGGVLRASFERMLATVLGAGIACIVSFGRLAHAPELLLLAVALCPLALIAAHNSAYRTAMIAAIIVLSAPAVSGAPLYVAGVRMLGVSLGAAIGALVSVTVLPSRREAVVVRAAAKLLEEFIPLLQYALAGNTTDPRTRDKLEVRIRQSLRELGLLVRDRPDGPVARGPAAAIVRFTIQIHADISFLKRELTACGPPASLMPTLAAFSQAFKAVALKVATMTRDAIAPPDIHDLSNACGQAAHVLREECPNSEGARLMLRRLVEDLASLSHAIARSRPATPPG